MYRIRVLGHDRASVTALTDLIAAAAIHDGRHAVAVPGPAPERIDAPVETGCRIDDAPIRTHGPVDVPDAILVLDPALLTRRETLRGLPPDGLVLVNAPGPVNDPAGVRLVTVPASEIASAHGGGRRLDAPMLGAFAAVSQAVSLVAVRKAVLARSVAELAGAECGYERLQSTGPFTLNATEAIAAVMEAHHAP
ncbi:MAG TPA: 2-oxoacid:acceptor oxidoreductase family protein [Actinospica sp.]|jgi:pyruvate ferredoxin oxidoreductase gamma subunit|nr:2-oxoacid:acceptor oxidoreductase family protein [Actinospica sp.]